MLPPSADFPLRFFGWRHCVLHVLDRSQATWTKLSKLSNEPASRNLPAQPFTTCGVWWMTTTPRPAKKSKWRFCVRSCHWPKARACPRLGVKKCCRASRSLPRKNNLRMRGSNGWSPTCPCPGPALRLTSRYRRPRFCRFGLRHWQTRIPRRIRLFLFQLQ